MFSITYGCYTLGSLSYGLLLKALLTFNRGFAIGILPPLLADALWWAADELTDEVNLEICGYWIESWCWWLILEGTFGVFISDIILPAILVEFWGLCAEGPPGIWGTGVYLDPELAPLLSLLFCCMPFEYDAICCYADIEFDPGFPLGLKIDFLRAFCIEIPSLPLLAEVVVLLKSFFFNCWYCWLLVSMTLYVSVILREGWLLVADG